MNEMELSKEFYKLLDNLYTYFSLIPDEKCRPCFAKSTTKNFTCPAISDPTVPRGGVPYLQYELG